jgi:amino acid permease
MTSVNAHEQRESQVSFLSEHDGVPDAPIDNAKEPDGSVMSTAVNITLNVIGGGLLTIPVAFDQTSLFPGIFLILFIAGVSVFSMAMLTFCAQRTGRYSYKDLLQFAFNERAGKAFECILAFYTYGILIGYGRIIADSMPTVAKSFMGLKGFFGGQIFWLLVSGAIFLPLSSVKSLSLLKYSSIVGFVTILYLGFMVVFRFGDESYAEQGQSGPVANDVNWFHLTANFFRAIPVMSTSFSCHYNIPVFYGELEGRNPRKMFQSIGLFAAFSIPFYLMVGVICMLMFGHYRLGHADGDVMKNFAADDTAFNVARFGFYIQFLCSYPLVALACRRAINVLCFGSADQSQKTYIIQATLRVVSSCIISYFVPSIDTVFTINGALFGLAIVVIIPSVIYLKIFSPEFDDTHHRGDYIGSPVGQTMSPQRTEDPSFPADDKEGIHGTDVVASQQHVFPPVAVLDADATAFDHAMHVYCYESKPLLRRLCYAWIVFGFVGSITSLAVAIYEMTE